MTAHHPPAGAPHPGPHPDSHPDSGSGSIRTVLLEAILRLSFLRGRFQLSSGAMSDYYLDLRRTTLDPDGLASAVAVLYPALQEYRVDAIGGPTLGADPLVAGLILEARRRGDAMQGFLVRGAVKDHGTGRMVEGHCRAGSRVAVIDDVVTRGGSILRAVEAVRGAGAIPVLALTIVDREEGGRATLEREGIPLYAPFLLGEILKEAAERGL